MKHLILFKNGLEQLKCAVIMEIDSQIKPKDEIVIYDNMYDVLSVNKVHGSHIDYVVNVNAKYILSQKDIQEQAGITAFNQTDKKCNNCSKPIDELTVENIVVLDYGYHRLYCDNTCYNEGKMK